ncbi:MAG: hypothetical protein ACK5C5_08250 [Bacteroidota bacterium]
MTKTAVNGPKKNQTQEGGPRPEQSNRSLDINNVLKFDTWDKQACKAI